MREVVNGLMYILSTGCQWRAIPKDLPTRRTVYGYFELWNCDGTLDRIHHALYIECRERGDARRLPPPRSSTARASRARKRGACIDPPGYDAGKKIKGKKRHILVDTDGLLMQAIVHAADIQDRDGGALVMATLFGIIPFLPNSTPMAAIRDRCFRAGMKKALTQVNVEIVKRSDQAKSFVVLPSRWVVERTFAWLGRCRRLAKDWECLNRKALAFLKLSSIRLMLRKLCNSIIRAPRKMSRSSRIPVGSPI